MNKSTLLKKKIGDKIYNQEPINIHKKIIREPHYTTKGEYLLIIKDTPNCVLTLDYEFNESIKIKSLTKVTIIPKNSSIDEFYEELQIEKGACVELEYFEGSWYIMSSDGIKLD